MIGKKLRSKQKKSIRVCLLIDAWEPVWGGGQTHVWELSQQLIKDYQIEVSIFTRNLKDSRGVVYKVSENYLNGRLKIFRSGPTNTFDNIFGRITWMISVLVDVYKAHRIEPFTLLHGHAYLGAIPTRILAQLLQVPSIFTVHGSNNLDLRENKIATFIEEILLTKIKFDNVISVSKHFLRYKNVNKNIQVIPNGITISKTKGINRTRRNAKFKILWVGRLEKVKAIDTLLYAFQKIYVQQKNATLVIVGSGTQEPFLKKLSKRLNIQHRVKFLGKKKGSALRELYQQADLFVLSSVSEGSPISIFEAWAAKVPVMVSDVGDNAHYVASGKNGYLFMPGDSEQLATLLMNAMKNKYLPTMGTNGYNLVRKKYTWKISAYETMKIYKRLTAHR